MNVLLDTHVFIWFVMTPEYIDAETLRILRSETTNVSVSHASVWEIAVKQAAGKMTISKELAPWFVGALERARLDALPIDIAAIAKTSELPTHHRDPFDRLLIAQAVVHGLVFCTRDRRIADYGIPLLRT